MRHWPTLAEDERTPNRQSSGFGQGLSNKLVDTLWINTFLISPGMGAALPDQF
jgi:hypothetical protein